MPVNKNKSTQRLVKTLAQTVPKSASASTHTHATAKVKSISGDSADCQLLGRYEYEESQLIRDVRIADSCKWIPVSATKNEKLKVGDTVYIGFNDHDLSNFSGKGQTYLIDSERRHDLSDGIIEAVITHG